MKKTGFFAILLAATITAGAFAGCSDKNESSSSRPPRTSSESTQMDHDEIGSNVIKGEIGKEVTENDTSFTLNSVISAKNDTGEQFIYMDITLRNSTANAYTLSTLNNLYIEVPGSSGIITSDVRTQLYAKQNFKDTKFYEDPFDIPSNGQFSGIIGGFAIEGDAKEFTLGFYPTGDDPNAKGTVIKYDITAADLAAPSAEILK